MTTNRCTETFHIAATDETVTCGRRAASPSEVCGHDHVCLDCFEAWMMENEHNDYGHDTPADGCPECGTYDPRGKQGSKGHTNTAAKSWTSHANCQHPRTPKDRAACRKARKA